LGQIHYPVLGSEDPSASRLVEQETVWRGSAVGASQVIRDLDGIVVCTGEFEHAYQFKDGLVERNPTYRQSFQRLAAPLGVGTTCQITALWTRGYNGLYITLGLPAGGKHALIAHQRYAHAKQFKRANRALKTIRTYLGRVTRDIGRKIQGDAERESVFAHPLMLARRVRAQRQHQRGKKVYSLHAPEVECIGKGKAHRPYEFGVKVSLATTLNRSKGGLSIAHAKALPGNPGAGPRA
jgi:hypothetical protein